MQWSFLLKTMLAVSEREEIWKEVGSIYAEAFDMPAEMDQTICRMWSA